VCSDEREQHQREHVCAERQQLRDIPAERVIGAAAAVLGGGAWVLVRGAELGGAESKREYDADSGRRRLDDDNHRRRLGRECAVCGLAELDIVGDCRDIHDHKRRSSRTDVDRRPASRMRW